MRIEEVRAHAFGPFRDETLALAPGLTLVYGPNEAGKSSWHAALYAALCGLRRGPGRPSHVAEFERRHRPWDDPENWRVSCIVALVDGRRLEIHHDLAGRVESRIVDVDTNDDLSHLHMYDGAPDGASLLGLTRDVLPRTIFVRQADVLRVLEDPGAIQTYLQRAVGTGGDETAQEAIERLEAFHRDHVGSERATTRPLPVARREVDEAEAALDAARRAHREYVHLLGASEEAGTAVAAAEERLERARLVRAHRELEALERRLERARSLHASAEVDLEDDGETEPAEEVEGAWTAWQEARSAVAAHAGTRDDDGEPPDVRGASPAELRAVADRLEAAAPEVDAGLERELADLTARRKPRVVPLAAGSVVAVVGLVLVAAGQTLPGLALLVAGVGVVAAALLVRRGADPARVAQLEARLAVQRAQEQEASSRRSAAMERAAAWELPPDPAELRRLAAQVEQAALAGERLAAWQERAQDLDTRLNEAEARLRELLEHRAVDGATDPGRELPALIEAYRDACRSRSRRAATAAQSAAALEEVLAGETLSGLEAELMRRRADLPPPPPDGEDPRTAEQLEEELTSLRDQAARLGGQLAERGAPSVAEAEERLARARAELARVERLAKTIATTTRFLAVARDDVQRDFAPRLRDAVADRLAEVTQGRYTGVRVHAENLTVEVSGPDGRWRDASMLSHGTSEQVYLLLRIAIAEGISTTGEPAPLVLDDVTIQSDAVRTAALLDLLRVVAGERQIVLFTQEEEVRAWAESLDGAERHRIVELASPTTR